MLGCNAPTALCGCEVAALGRVGVHNKKSLGLETARGAVERLPVDTEQDDKD